MAQINTTPYLEPSGTSGRAFIEQGIEGSVVMLNLLRFREIADYSATPHLAPPEPVSGKEAYQLYMNHTLPYLQKSGGEMIFYGKGGNFLIGPSDEYWDVAMLVRQRSVNDFMAFATDSGYLNGLGHRTAALEDSRLLPLIESNLPA